MSTPYRLHYAPDNASLIVRLALLELGQPFETTLVDRRQHQQSSPAYLALNPLGLIPTLETPQGPIFETAAILLWLADTHGALAPAPASPDRGAFLKWLFFTSNSLHTALIALFYPHKFVGSDTGAQAALHATTSTKLLSHLDTLEALAAQQPAWFNAATPGVLDLYVATCLRWMALYPAGGTGWFSLARTPHLLALAIRIEQRPAALAASRSEGLGPTPFSAPRAPNPPEGSAT